MPWIAWLEVDCRFGLSKQPLFIRRSLSRCDFGFIFFSFFGACALYIYIVYRGYVFEVITFSSNNRSCLAKYCVILALKCASSRVFESFACCSRLKNVEFYMYLCIWYCILLYFESIHPYSHEAVMLYAEMHSKIHLLNEQN